MYSGAVFSPLGSSDSANSVILPPVTMVFCSVDCAKQYISRQRRDAHEVHNELVAVLRSVLLQVRVTRL